MIENTSVMPPQIRQYYSALLLSTPMIGDNEEKLWRLFEKLKKIINGKRMSPEAAIRIKQGIKEFEEIYGRIKKKKENADPKVENKTKEPFYFIRLPHRGQQAIFEGLRYGGISTTWKLRRHNAFQKAKRRRLI